jgi:hypothetical protein
VSSAALIERTGRYIEEYERTFASSGEFTAIVPSTAHSTSLFVKYAEVEATYSNFRRFQVITAEDIKPPQ